MLVVAEYAVALGVGYLIVALIANRQFGANLPLPSFLRKK